MLACKKAPVYIHLQSGPRDYTPAGKPIKVLTSKALIPNFVTSHQQRPRNIISCPRKSVFGSSHQASVNNSVATPCGLCGKQVGWRALQTVLFRSVSSLFFLLDVFLFCRRPSQWTVRKSSKRKPSEGKVLLCLSLLFPPSAPTRKRLNFTLFLRRGDASTSRVFDSPSRCLMFICARSTV